ncbi:hypothetical protein AB0F88_39980 [Streptosporangium sp. NPDC023963]|uniref:hypothetical protein n=1 Tax=Streptosporangium sp. NPDC023963 TaxID=3155608 RepID=UPI0034452762
MLTVDQLDTAPADLTPAEVIAWSRCSGLRYGRETPCEVCRRHAEQNVAALAEHGMVIVPAPPVDTLQRLREYASHRRGCRSWVAQACDCGLADLDTPEAQ